MNVPTKGGDEKEQSEEKERGTKKQKTGTLPAALPQEPRLLAGGACTLPTVVGLCSSCLCGELGAISKH